MSLVADHTHPEPADAGRALPASLRSLPASLLGRLRRSGSDLSIALGALSIVTFWTFGLGIVLGVAAVGAGAVASRSEAVEDSEPKSLEALFGILSGAFGILAGAVFLLVAGPNW